MDYNTQVWSPYLKKDILKIEKIQKRYTKIACMRCQIHFSSYQDRLYKLNLLSLEHRRIYNDLILFFKIVNNLSDIALDNYCIYETNNYNLRAGSRKIKPRHSFKNNQWLNSYFVRSCFWWNKLPLNISSIKSLNTFKIQIKKLDFNRIMQKLV